VAPDRTLTLDGVVVREWGLADAAARPLVFWHGLNPFGALQLNEAGPAWAARGFRVVAPAAPGFGDSPPLADLDDYRPTRLAALELALADELGLARFAHVGWSWGASIGVHFAAAHGDRLTALVLLDAGHTDIDGGGATLEEAIENFERDHAGFRFPDWEAFLELARERRPVWRPAVEERLRAGMREAGDEIVARSDPRAAAAAYNGLRLEQPSSTFAALAALELPILLVLATRNDTGEAAERFAAAVPRAELRTVDSDHDLLADAPVETIELVADWLDEKTQ
jgi:pimeloyl-ACP methyl ester carboxylesterase